MSSLAIRAVDETALDEVAALHAAAFGASPHGYHGEAELVRALHEAGDALVSLGAWQRDALVGHVLFSRMRVHADALPVAAAALGPIAVAPDWRRRGIGAALIAAGHEALQKAGVQLVFVLGDPAYYGRFGYTPDRAAPFASPYAGPFFMACTLDSTLPRPQRGEAIHAAAFSRLG